MTSDPTARAWVAITARFPQANFLQSPQWARANQLMGHGTDFFASDRVWCSAIIKSARRGRYLEVPGGPLLDWSNARDCQDTFDRLRQMARQHRCAFIRLRPQLPKTAANLELLRSLGARPAPMHLHAEHTVMVDLTPAEPELLAAMRRQTRYEVRRAEKLGITVRRSRSQAAIEQFHQLQLDTARRQQFVPPRLADLRAEVSAFGDAAQIYSAYQGDDLIASALVLHAGAEGEYFEAASSPLGRKLPGAYALQWQVMRDLKKQGLQRYNLWGIAPPDQPQHRYAGVTTFKTGFGGEVVEYLPAHDIVICRPRYLVNWVVETIRKKRRRL